MSVSRICPFSLEVAQQTPDLIHIAFFLLQNQLDLTIINIFTPDSEKLYVCQQFSYRTTIIKARSYLLSDKLEDMAAETPGLNDMVRIRPFTAKLRHINGPYSVVP